MVGSDAIIRLLEEGIEDIKSGRRESNKAIIVFLTEGVNHPEEYSVGWGQAGLKMSESLGLLDLCKTMFINEMGYGDG